MLMSCAISICPSVRDTHFQRLQSPRLVDKVGKARFDVQAVLDRRPDKTKGREQPVQVGLYGLRDSGLKGDLRYRDGLEADG